MAHADPYDADRYFGVPIADAHPWRLAWTAFIHGGPALSPRFSNSLRVLEIGCGDGATLLPMAAAQPDWIVLGIDSSAAAIQTARDRAAASKLANATFRHADLAQCDLETAAWDIILAHGVYSWISPAHQASLRTLIRNALAPDGLAYVSFNAQPGWSVRGRVRDMLRKSTDVEVRSLLDRLSDLLPSDPWGGLLGREFERVRHARPDYFVHEYLAEHNHAFWLSEFVRDFNAAGLSYIGDAQFDQPTGRPYEQVRTQLGIDGIRGDELADLIGYRQFRCAVMCRDDAARQPPASDAAILERADFSGSVSCEDDEIDLSRRIEQRFRSQAGVEILAESPLCKAVLIEMTRLYPEARTAAAWTQDAATLLDERGCDSELPDAKAELESGLLALWRVGALEARLSPGDQK